MLRVLLFTLTGLSICSSSGVASPLDALNLNGMSGIELSGQTRQPTALILAEVQFVRERSSWRPGLGLGSTMKGGRQLEPAPMWRASAQYRFDVIEFVPYGSIGLMGELTDRNQYKVIGGFGLERMYRTGWLTFLELSASVRLNSNTHLGGIILLGLGYQYTLNALY